MRLDPLVKKKYPDLVIGYAIARNVKVERTVDKLEEEKGRVINEVRDKYALVLVVKIEEITCFEKLLQENFLPSTTLLIHVY